ncbi:MAG: hypothetical protein AB7P20_13720 [Rhizobiaceae bacterium]
MQTLLTTASILALLTAISSTAMAHAKKPEPAINSAKQHSMMASVNAPAKKQPVKSVPRIGADIAIDFLPTDF